MTHTGSEMKSTSTSSIIGPSLSSTGGDELEEREEHEKSTEESVSVSQTPTTSKITIKKKTQLGISVAGEWLQSMLCLLLVRFIIRTSYLHEIVYETCNFNIILFSYLLCS